MTRQFAPKDQIGKYIIEERLGRGGMAEVFKAVQPNLNRSVAIKIMHAYLADDPNFLTRFKREAHAMAAIEHPNIVRVYDFEAHDDYYYIVMEFLSGGTLKERIDRLSISGESMPLALAIRYVLEMADALSFAHSRGMVHRDIKPANIMFNDQGAAILTDFGIARLLTGTSQTTDTGAMIGTPAYMSPEQGLGEAGNERSDIYSLGVLAYQLFTGRLPHEGETPLAVVLKHINDTPIRPTLLNGDLTTDIEAVILKAMAKNPEDRYSTGAAMARDLRRLIKQDGPIGLGSAGLPDRLLEDQATPPPGKTWTPMAPFENDPQLMAYYKSLPTPPPVPKQVEPGSPPTLLSGQPYEIGQENEGHAVTRVALEPPLFPEAAAEVQTGEVRDEEVTVAEVESPAGPANGKSNGAGGRDESEIDAFPVEMSAALARLTRNEKPAESVLHVQRREKAARARRIRTLSRRAHRAIWFLSLAGGLVLGYVLFQAYFTPDDSGLSPIEQFNGWLNDLSGGTTADDVNLGQMDAELAVRAGVEPPAVVLNLEGLSGWDATWEARLELQAAAGSWEETDFGPFTPDAAGLVSWAIPEGLETGADAIYRWVVREPGSREPAAVSDPFSLPEGQSEILEIQMAVNRTQ